MGYYDLLYLDHRSGTGDGRITSRYTGSDVTISLTNQAGGDTGLTVEDIGTFTIWCKLFSVFFTLIEIPSGLILGAGVSRSSFLWQFLSYIDHPCTA